MVWPSDSEAAIEIALNARPCDERKSFGEKTAQFQFGTSAVRFEEPELAYNATGGKVLCKKEFIYSHVGAAGGHPK